MTLDPTLLTIQPALSLLKLDWVHDFFFSYDEPRYLQQLQQALLQPVIPSAKLLFRTHTPRHPNPLQAAHEIDDECHCLVAGSFSTGNITVGFGLEDKVRSTSDLSIDNGFSIHRFLRDDENGFYFDLCDHREEGIVEITSCTQLTPGSHSNVCLQFRREPILRLLSQLDSSTDCDMNQLQDACTYSFNAFEYRPCPSCGSGRPTSCTCPPLVRRKKHPLDFETEIANMKSYGGGYHGFASLRLYDDSGCSFIGNFISESNVIMQYGAQMRALITRQALRKITEMQNLNILSLLIPNSRLSDPALASKSIKAAECLTLNRTGLGNALVPSHNRTATYLPETEDYDAILDTAMQSQSELKIEMEADTQSCISILPLLTDGLEKKSSPERGGEASSVTPEPMAMPTELILPQRNVPDSHQKMQHMEARPIAPAPTFSVDLFKDSNTRNDELSLLAKAEIRKHRNRISALQSNERKRQYLLKLKDDIVLFTQRESELRKKEQELRVENIQLRQSVRGSSLGSS